MVLSYERSMGVFLVALAPITGSAPLNLPASTVKTVGDWTLTQHETGAAHLQIGDSHTLGFADQGGLLIENNASGMTTLVSPELRVDLGLDGTVDFQHWGAVTFRLEDATKITVQTKRVREPDYNGYVMNRVIVTNADQALIVRNLSPYDQGPPDYTLRGDGRKIDNRFEDNLIVREDSQAQVWRRGKRTVTQATMKQTRPNRFYGSGNNVPTPMQTIQRLMTALTVSYTQTLHDPFDVQYDDVSDDNHDASSESAERYAIEQDALLRAEQAIDH